MEEHIMHDEWMDISLELLETLRAENKRKIVTVGTTSTRTLESIFWMGNKVCNNPLISLEDLKITQWEPYESPKIYTKEEALTALIDWMKTHQLTHLIIETGIIIAPSYSFKMVQGLITNFHQPHSTLLLLVAALVGETWKEIYDYALTHDFRFLSYGDGCLLLPNG
jgi:S-adenosylmethionine:tRNA ribosyltransferase-isomerase